VLAMAISANFTTPVDVTPYCLWVDADHLAGHDPDAEDIAPLDGPVSAMVSIIRSCMFSSGPSSMASSSP